MNEGFYKEVSYSEARKRNLLIGMVKMLSTRKFEVTMEFTKKEISSVFYFRISDLHNYIDEFFQIHGDKYIICSEKVNKIDDILKKHISAVNNLNSVKALFIKSFGRFY